MGDVKNFLVGLSVVAVAVTIFLVPGAILYDVYEVRLTSHTPRIAQVIILSILSAFAGCFLYIIGRLCLVIGSRVERMSNENCN